MHGPPLHLGIIASSLPYTVCSLMLPIFCNPRCCCDAGSFLDWKFPLNLSYFLSYPNQLLHKRGKKNRWQDSHRHTRRSASVETSEGGDSELTVMSRHLARTRAPAASDNEDCTFSLPRLHGLTHAHSSPVLIVPCACVRACASSGYPITA